MTKCVYCKLKDCYWNMPIENKDGFGICELDRPSIDEDGCCEDQLTGERKEEFRKKVLED